MSKQRLVAQVLQKRIAHADHVLQGLPSERRLADELGISRNTVRSAVQSLVEEGVLVRTDTGRLQVRRPVDPTRTRVIGVMTPTGGGFDYASWQTAVIGALEGQPATLRAISYAHWADPTISEAIGSLDGLFFVPPPEKIPTWLSTEDA